MGEAWGPRHLRSVLGVALLALAAPMYVGIGLVAEDWVRWPAVLVWLGLLVLALRWFRGHPTRTLMVGAGAVVLWLVAVSFFDRVLGWTA